MWVFGGPWRDWGLPPPSLPEGLKLVNGSLIWRGSANVGGVSIEARVRAVKDGEWFVFGAVARHNLSPYESFGSGGLKITVHNGKAVDIAAPPPGLRPFAFTLLFLLTMVPVIAIYGSYLRRKNS